LPAAAFGDWSTEAQVGTYQLVRCADPACQNYSAGSIPDAGGTPVIEFPEGNEPVVAFVRNRPAERTADLVMVTCGDSTCSDGGSSTVVTQAGVNHHTLDVTFADDGFPVFVFDEPKLRVARCDDASCVGEVEVSVIDLDIEFDRVIDIGDNGLPLLAYASTGADHIREVRIASCEDSACTRGTIRTLDSDQRMIGIDMVVDSTGKPVLAYQTGEALGITRCADPVCATESLRSLEWDQARFQVTEPALERAAGWERIGPFEDLSDRLNISAMATFPDGLVAVGTQGRQPTAWLSVDGTGWDEFPIAAAGDVMDVVAGGPGLIAVGATCSDFTGSSDQPCDPAIWTSPDATTWTPVMTTEAFGGCSSLASVQPDCQTWIHEIHPTATGFLANGVDIIDATWPNTSVGWTSTDGLSWQRVSTLRTDERPPYPEFVAETDWENGRYGLGTRCTGDGSRFACEPQGWISRDGMTWEPVQLDPADFGASDHAALIEDGLELTSGKFGLMAIGHNLDPTTWHETPMMFLSENGLDWTAYQLDDEMALAINDLISFGDRVIASGSRGVWAWTPPS
jgi:hypothetical protein